MAESRVESELTKRLIELRKAMRRKTASVDECLEFMKVKDATSDGESFNMSDSLDALICLKSELPLENAVSFLKSYQDSLDKTFSDNNWLYIIEVGFLLVEDLVEMSNISEAEDELKQILQWLRNHECAPAEALATSKLSMLAWQRDSKREAKDYYRKCFVLLQSIIDRRKESDFVMPGYEMKFAMYAFVECGKFWMFVIQKYDSAEKFFLKALEYCPRDHVANRCCIYSQLYRNETLAKKFQISKEVHLRRIRCYVGLGVDSSDYFDVASELRESFIRTGDYSKNMPEFQRNDLANQVYITLTTCMTSESRYIVQSSTHQLLITLSQKQLEDNEPYLGTGFHLACCAVFVFEKNMANYRKFKEQAKKILYARLDELESKRDAKLDEESVRLLKCSLLLILELCLREKSYKEAEEHSVKTLTVAYRSKYAFVDESNNNLYKGDIHFYCAYMHYLQRGRFELVKMHCISAMKYYRLAGIEDRLQLTTCLLQSLNLPVLHKNQYVIPESLSFMSLMIE